MSYLYKGMAGLGSKSGAGGEVSGSVLLTWHEKVGLACRHTWREGGHAVAAERITLTPQLTEVAGVGCIVRVMTDRRTL
jgi:actin related protein 2/3 complex subunit 5